MTTGAPMIGIRRLNPEDREPWEQMFRAYIAFYQRIEPDVMYERTWRELLADSRIHALGATIDRQLVGIVHFLIHPSTGPDVCYLQDLFTAPEARRKGVGRALITATGTWARERGCHRLYWHTQASNETARRLYDQVAENHGFIQYRMELH